MFSRLGAKVNVFEILPTVFKPGEASLVNQLEKILKEEGIYIRKGVRVVKAYKEKGKKVLIYRILEGRNEEGQEIYGDEILLATGKTPNTDALNLEKAKVDIDGRKAIIVNEYLQTSNENIYAAGDVTNLPLRLETTAGREGSIAVENAFEGNREKIDYNEVPYAIFTDPSLAGVDLTEEEMMNKYGVCSCRTLQFKDLPKAIIKNRTEGAVKLVIHPDTAQILGIHILAPDAGDLIAQGILIIRNKMTIYDVISMLPVFPTFSEAIKLCALSFMKDISKISCCV
ncbi:MAG: FAD-dependent oxidoreductase, partial [Candidatus Ratteibacteria bacterium]